jgi:ribosome-associated heat shock protein Hsp15
MRIDKFLWCVRLYKTRSLATEQVRLGKITAKGETLKPSKELKLLEEFEIRRGPVVFSYKVLAFPKARQGAKLVSAYLQDITTEEERKKWLLLQDQLRLTRDRGTGRPTKKDRREMDAYLDIFQDLNDDEE